MNHFFENLVIGAGPAGAGCGIALQKSGGSVCLIDKAVFPRQKTCAGLVTAKTYELLQSVFTEDELEGLFIDRAFAVQLFDKTRLLTTAPVKDGVRLVRRDIFDNALVEKYKSLGGTIFEGERRLRVDFKTNRVLLSNGRELRFNNLIFADGALSMAHKPLKVGREKLAFGIETHLPRRLMDINSVNLHFGYLDDGYIWAFPHGDEICVGAGGRFNKKKNFRKVLSTFLSDSGVNPEEVNFVGAFLPYGYAVPQEKLPKNTMLIGDAAGFADPISGEGLYMALQSGFYAAEAALTKAPKENYLESVSRFKKIVNEGRRTRKAFFSPAIQKLFIKKVEGKSDLVAYYFDNVVEHYRCDYGSLPKLFAEYKRRGR